ncbi:FAD-dependent monooxygenase [Pigmentiphaga litoralis]|uniref:2-polyprenyl-6-methoxyphenol hydroxylase-like FAD-dependent oxidoreductase n=1 Tax=Pigmentiphaga litoralis TaxID=516702 RepID=A0A7Y9LM05_9BURK|nr:FAD-dependent monooxygenase [Pigmentiphaga litoralis]NYE21906.1 2-polyprenyl-6-methoxyphenol hydroxylase-like FAD-dependent oxidoreductase [Pigmentiphaga litoralis]NYE84479.1 2-polyprenyl-6-methoxyphenol hydroxylase-like FAD-dependent oxidoreductase [Pigmentiphaga litoralis]
MSTTINTSVAIVGAGPIGLSLAIDLAWRGVDVVLLEKSDGKVDHPRLGLIAVRTMEFFRRWGLTSDVRHCGFPDDFGLSIEFCTSMTGHLLERDNYPSIRDMETPSWTPEKKQRCPQHWLDPILKRRLADFSEARLELNASVHGLEESADGVTVSAVNTETGAPLTVHAKYVVGCDGATSTVRTLLGISMEGNAHLNYSMGILFESPDLLERCGKATAERFLFIGPEGTWGNLTVIDGRAVWRLTVYGSAAKFDMENFNAEEWIRRALGTDQIDFTVLSVLPWKRTELIASSYGTNRILLAGDAAHTMSPTGGMGMNTGLCDATDLAWKLEAVIKGWGGNRLIASYEEERKPIATRNAAYSTHNFKTWTSPAPCDFLLEDSDRAIEARRTVGMNLKKATQAEWQSWGLQVGYRYEGSSICVFDGTPPTPDDYSTYVPTARPGSRAPHAWLADGLSTLDLFGRGFALLVFDHRRKKAIDCLLSAAQDREVPLAVTQIDKPEVAELYGSPMVLVRPDGHVAWRGADITDAGRILDIVRGADLHMAETI